MTDLMQFAGTHYYFRAVDRTSHERNARFLAELRHASAASGSVPQGRRALASRIAGALGLF
jgi:hypothetical protein